MAMRRVGLGLNVVAIAVLLAVFARYGLLPLFVMGAPYALIVASLLSPQSHSFVRMTFIVNVITLAVGMIAFLGTLPDQQTFSGSSGKELALLATALYGIALPVFNLRLSWELLKVAPHARPE
jgi:hypothetical protein